MITPVAADRPRTDKSVLISGWEMFPLAARYWTPIRTQLDANWLTGGTFCGAGSLFPPGRLMGFFAKSSLGKMAGVTQFPMLGYSGVPKDMTLQSELDIMELIN